MTSSTVENWLEWASNQETIWETVTTNWSLTTEPLKLTDDQQQSKNIEPFFSPAQLGIITGVLLAFFVNFKVNSNRSDYKWYKNVQCVLSSVNLQGIDFSNIVLTITVFLCFLLISPIILFVLFTFRIYREIAYFRIKKRYGNHFRGMLEGHDAVWALEHAKWKSVINIMAILENDHQGVAGKNVSGEILLTLRKRMASKLMGDYQPFPKLFYKRQNEFGYFFWTDLNNCSIEEYIRFADIPSNDDTISEEEFRNWIGACSNLNLPRNHSASWEILISKKPIRNDDNSLSYPILFRVHHALGDGVALLRFMLETIADKKPSIMDLWHQCSPKKIRNLMTIIPQDRIISSKDISASSTTYLPKWHIEINFSNMLERFQSVSNCLILFITSPACLFRTGALRQIDQNSLHGPDLSGEKFVAWICEDDKTHLNLFKTLKMIKYHYPGTRFSDVFLTAFSTSLQKYFQQISPEHVSTEMTIVIPARMEPTSRHLKLQNRFSVALQTLPLVTSIDSENSNLLKLRENIEKIKCETDKIRSTPDYPLNYWMLAFVSELFPEKVSSAILNSKHCTMVISNLPGPEHEITINNYKIKKISFWLPHRGTTGIGVTLLSYGGKLQFGFGGDKILLQNENDAKLIMSNTIEEIKRMGDLLSDPN